jgi:equilibrative nucleoside transporter 1/2/3
MTPEKHTSCVIPTEGEKLAKDRNRKIESEDRITEPSSLSELEEIFEKIPTLKSKTVHNITFIMMGIASLAGWNVTLSAFDFFEKKYPKTEFLNISTMFPIPIMLTNFIAGLACPYLAAKFSYNIRICGCLLATSAALLTTAFIALFINT